VREATRSILESAGLVVLSAENAEAAIKVYEASIQPIDLVMTDMILPGHSGRQLSEDLHQRSPDLKVLITSGYSSAEFAPEIPRSQTCFLAKPYSRRGLITKIEEMFALPSQVSLPCRAPGKAG
jgi:DNA-binding NtrC family response regulator